MWLVACAVSLSFLQGGHVNPAEIGWHDAGSGNVTFNGKPAAEYLGFNPQYVGSVRDPLEILGLEGAYDVIVSAHGGGVMGALIDSLKPGGREPRLAAA